MFKPHVGQKLKNSMLLQFMTKEQFVSTLPYSQFPLVGDFLYLRLNIYLELISVHLET